MALNVDGVTMAMATLMITTYMCVMSRLPTRESDADSLKRAAVGFSFLLVTRAKEFLSTRLLARGTTSATYANETPSSVEAGTSLSGETVIDKIVFIKLHS
eukprot:1940374-Amphidinium_carterae.1